MGAIKIRQLKYRQNYSFDSTSTAFFFFTRFIWHEVRQEFYSEKNRVFPFGFHFESWASPKVLLLCTQNTLLGTAPPGKKKSISKWQKRSFENGEMVLKIGEKVVVWLMLFPISAPLQDVVLAQVQLQAGDCQELWIKHTKFPF